MNGQFKYQPLDNRTQEIRVLQVHPYTDPASDIECTLIHVSLRGRPNTTSTSDPPQFWQPQLSHNSVAYGTNGYAALSYVWGNPNPAQTVYLDGSPRSITPNLAGALRRFRDSKRYLWLWTDALCINQSNKAEVSQQVALMGLVYKKASKVLIWLGPSDDYSDKAMDVLHNFTTRLKDIHSLLDGKPDYMALRRLLPKRNYSDSRTVMHLFERNYWQRVWTLQEMVLNPNSVVYCGTRELDWMYTCLALEPEFTGVPLDESPMMTSLFRLVADRHNAGLILERPEQEERASDGEDLLRLLMIAREKNTSVEIDRIFGVFGLLDDGVAINPDYQKSIYTVCREVAQYFIRKQRSLDILTACKSSLRADRDIVEPSDNLVWESWVPDWTKSANTSPDPRSAQGVLYLIADPYTDCTYMAAGATTTKTQFCENNSSLLMCEGIEFDTVTWVHPGRPSRSIFTDFGLYEDAFQDASPYGNARQQVLAHLSTKALGKCGRWENGDVEAVRGLLHILYAVLKTSVNVRNTSLDKGKAWLHERGIDFDELVVGKQVSLPMLFALCQNDGHEPLRLFRLVSNKLTLLLAQSTRAVASSRLAGIWVVDLSMRSLEIESVSCMEVEYPLCCGRQRAIVPTFF
jgi:hypothetical protein